MAYLLAADPLPGSKVALDTILMDENRDLLVPAPSRQSNIFADRSVRSKTEPLEEEDKEDEEDESHCNSQKRLADNNDHLQRHINGPCLKILFSHRARTRKGHVVGRDRNSYIVLPKLPAISWEHFAFTYDHEKKLIVRDLGSTVGTRVLYFEEKDSTPGFGIDFSAQGPDILGGRPAVIKLRDDLQFKLVVPNHDITSADYLERVERFLQNTAPVEDLLPGLGFASRTRTELATPAENGIEAGADVPGAILWTKPIGKGSFGMVYYAWDVTTRKVYALKKPLLGYYNRDSWIEEAKIMINLRHVSNFSPLEVWRALSVD